LQLGDARHGQVHDLHIWQITSDQSALSAHVLVADGFHCLTVAQFLWALPPPRND
jgi:cobalt-zinc-cadmium efflux system protein